MNNFERALCLHRNIRGWKVFLARAFVGFLARLVGFFARLWRATSPARLFECCSFYLARLLAVDPVL